MLSHDKSMLFTDAFMANASANAAAPPSLISLSGTATPHKKSMRQFDERGIVLTTQTDVDQRLVGFERAGQRLNAAVANVIFCNSDHRR